MKVRISVAAFAILPFLLLADRIDACSCVRGIAVCQAYQDASVVFIGTVVDSIPVIAELEVERLAGGKDKITHPERRYRFSVERSFKGAQLAELEVQTGVGGGDCGFPFESGKRYVVFAYQDPKTKALHTGICSRTSPFSEASEDLDYLLGLPESASKTRISGSLWVYTNERDKSGYQEPKPMSGAKILITGQGKRVEAVTNDQGVYVSIGLPPGKYKVEAQLPSNLAPATQEVKLPVGGCAVADMTTRSDGRISGRVLDSQGRGLPNARVELVPSDTGKSAREILMMSEHEKTDAQGGYRFREMPPGHYYLGINLREEPRGELPIPRTYYPGTPDADRATIIVLGDGEELTGYDLLLPPPIPVRRIEGVFLWSNGRPVTPGSVSLTDSEQTSIGRRYASAEVDQRGRFSLEAFDGIECWVHGSTYHATDRMVFVNSRPFKIAVNADTKALRVIVTVPDIGPAKGTRKKPQ